MDPIPSAPRAINEWGDVIADAGDSLTTVDALRDATHRHLAWVLDAIERSGCWERRHAGRERCRAGFLVAIDTLRRTTADAARQGRIVSTAPCASHV